MIDIRRTYTRMHAFLIQCLILDNNALNFSHVEDSLAWSMIHTVTGAAPSMSLAANPPTKCRLSPTVKRGELRGYFQTL